MKDSLLHGVLLVQVLQRPFSFFLVLLTPRSQIGTLAVTRYIEAGEQGEADTRATTYASQVQGPVLCAAS